MLGWGVNSSKKNNDPMTIKSPNKLKELFVNNLSWFTFRDVMAINTPSKISQALVAEKKKFKLELFLHPHSDRAKLRIKKKLINTNKVFFEYFLKSNIRRGKKT